MIGVYKLNTSVVELSATVKSHPDSERARVYKAELSTTATPDGLNINMVSRLIPGIDTPYKLKVRS